MKIKRKDLRKLIHINLMNEIVTLSTGNTNYEDVKYEKCENIVIPPIFKQVFLNKFYEGATPREIRSAMKQHFPEVLPGGKMSAKERAARIDAIFSDDAINNITSLLSSFANIAGVPAVFCKFLQLAINEFAELIDVFVDIEKDDDDGIGGDALPFVIKTLKDSMTMAMSKITTDSTGINTDKIFIGKNFPVQSNPDYNSVLLLACGGELFNLMPAFSGAMKLQDNNSNFFAALRSIDKSFLDFQDEMNQLYDRITKSDRYEDIGIKISKIIKRSLLDNNLTQEISETTYEIESSLTSPDIINVLNKNDESASEEKILLNKRKYIKSCMSLFKYIFSLCFQHLFAVLPRRSGINNPAEYYENNPDFYKLLRQLAMKYLS